jgi:hypothetical protein
MMPDSRPQSYVPAFEALLRSARVDDVSSELYCRKYLGHLLAHAPYYLSIYADVLGKVLDHSPVPINRLIMVDVGAGNGLLGIFAKFCGFYKVFLNDTDSTFIEASRKLTGQLGIEMDGYVLGGIESAKAYFADDPPTAVAGTDVIEHIYDLQAFFKSLKQLNPAMVSVFTTAANPLNGFKIKQLKKLQLKDEFEGGTPGDFTLFGSEPLEPFVKTREKIIRSVNPAPDEKAIEQLVRNTRGLNKNDIITATVNYQLTGQMPLPPAHPTNTCNPLSGSWTERILSLPEYKLLYSNNGYRLSVHDGYYDSHKKGLKGVFNHALNKFICILGHRISPFLVFVGYKD